MAIELSGNWRKGIAYDIHSLDSVYLGADQAGHDRWETTRSEMGELVYRLKYRGDRTVLPQIVALLERIKGLENFDYIVPIPPTDASRRHQPVAEIAIALGNRYGVRVLPDLLRKANGGIQLKNVDDPDERRELLRETMKIADKYDVAGAKILLIDDLFRSGATLTVATDLLLGEARAADVCVLTMTKTRSRR